MSFQLIDSNTPIEFLESFCRAAENDPSPAAQNMVLADWENASGSFLYKLYVEKTYDEVNRGGYLLQIKDDKIISGSGFSQWTVDTNVCLLYARTYVLPEYRNIGKQRIGKYIWEQLQYLRKFQYKVALATFDHYNEHIVKVLNGYNSLEKEYTIVDGEYYNKHGRKFVPNEVYPNKVYINSTVQSVVYYCEDPTYKETLLNTLKQCEV